MKIFKFGGGIIKDALSIQKLPEILEKYKDDKLVIVLSAIDKTTNQLENLINDYHYKKQKFIQSFIEIKQFHYNLASKLGLNEKYYLLRNLDSHFNQLFKNFQDYNSYPYDVLYDQVVSFGEVLSSTIVHYYLELKGFNVQWLDGRILFKTNEKHRSACIDENLTFGLLNEEIQKSSANIFITQGFIGSHSNNLLTTLGREGSDYTAAVLGSVLKAEKVIIWKDVAGVYNADPKYYPPARLIPQMSYNQAAELTGLGAKVLHHRTIQPLKDAGIPLEVKQYNAENISGSLIGKFSENDTLNIPVIIHRKNKILFIVKANNGVKPNIDDIKLTIEKHQLEINFVKEDKNQVVICLNHLIEPALALKEDFEKNYLLEILFGMMMVKVKNGNSEVFDEIKNDRKIVYEGCLDGVCYIFY